MLDPRALTSLLVALCFGCSSLGGPLPGARPPLRVLSCEPATAPRPEATPSENHGEGPYPEVTAPRIGAPGGSGAGSRRVVPVQSGKETVGGLPAGMAGGTGPAGRG
ncbi:MAG: hypothetical protein ABUL60_35115 [Myxococcales bacterium]